MRRKERRLKLLKIMGSTISKSMKEAQTEMMAKQI